MTERDIDTVGVAGSGIMGRGIALLLTNCGVATVLAARSAEAAGAAAEALEKERALAVRRKQLSPEDAERGAGLLQTTVGYEEFSRCELVIETVVEDLEIKRGVLAQLYPRLRGGTLVATNTSALAVAEIGSGAPEPERFFGLHFMNPAQTVNLVELARGGQTSAETVSRAKAFCKRIGRQCVEVADGGGFIVNRLLMLLINEAARMAEEGVASPADIDKSLRLACGHPMGPAALADFIGLDTVKSELETLAARLGERYAPAAILSRLVNAQKLGRKTGGGLLQAGKKLQD